MVISDTCAYKIAPSVPMVPIKTSLCTGFRAEDEKLRLRSSGRKQQIVQMDRKKTEKKEKKKEKEKEKEERQETAEGTSWSCVTSRMG